jgi:hypothetical protein
MNNQINLAKLNIEKLKVDGKLLFKVLKNQRSFVNGYDNHFWEIGKWYRAKGKLELCSNGFHLTHHPEKWVESGSIVYLAETRKVAEWADDKCVCRKVRILLEIPSAIYKKYEEDRATIYKKYEEDIAPIYKKYEEDRAPIDKKYEEDRATIYKKYEEDIAPIYKKYEEDRATIYKKYEEDIATIYKKYEEDRATIYKKYEEDRAKLLEQMVLSALSFSVGEK